jgi:hypothetical protein
MMITRAIPAADCDHRLRAAIGGGASPCGSGAGPLPSIDHAGALLDERRELAEWATTRNGNFHRSRCN